MLILLVVGNRIHGESINECYSRIHRPLVELLDPMVAGPVREAGISDLAIGEHKVLGSSLYLARDPFLYYYQSSLMVRSDLSLISRYLKHPPREPDYRGRRAHGEFCTTLQEKGCRLAVKILREKIHGRLAGILGR
jgi:lipoate-protein ligase A